MDIINLKCSIHNCNNTNCDIIGGDCELCGEWPLCEKHMAYTQHKKCQSKYYFKVNYKNKDEAKQMGLFYDIIKKAWYANNKKSYYLALDNFTPIEC